MPEEKSSRERLREIVERDRQASAAQVAEELGITRQRVWQLAREENIELVRPSSFEMSRIARRRWDERREVREPKARVITGGVAVPINHTIAGTIAEMLAAADLMARGFMVYFPLVRNHGCDLVIVDSSGRTEKIEVRSGKLSADGGRVLWQKPDKSHADRYAIVLTGEPVRYKPPFAGDSDR